MTNILATLLSLGWLFWTIGTGSELLFLLFLLVEKKKVYKRLKQEQKDFQEAGLPFLDFGWNEYFEGDHQKFVQKATSRLLWYGLALVALAILTAILVWEGL